MVFALHAAGRTKVIYETRPLHTVNESIADVLDGRIDPGLSRALFIQRALIEGEWDARHRFLAHTGPAGALRCDAGAARRRTPSLARPRPRSTATR